ncbi:hypothetical protein B2G71_13430 [Novosphingobium sp. PC22D]|uniref:shikimate dehydrogenase family protein n=1 Tax=Novosphingobium sp. PC22D TaxID=1962403 RepID=UPI000BF05D47|nr:shikimate dehydrogenase [Novosphingobium sp. PC22D]PEQ12139.1 hypothetical protein B2G71_13430 [Novosphingobium sp. PC22D]
MTRPYADVIGDPIAQSKSPLIHGFWLDRLGIIGGYERCHVLTEALDSYFADRRADHAWRGCNVTMPHKQAVMPLLDRISPEAERIGAVNTVVARDSALEGHNTDGVGFIEPLLPLIADKTRRFAYLVGSGGAARAIADALTEHGFTLSSFSRDPAKADREIGRYIPDKGLLFGMEALHGGPLARISGGADRINVLVNASPLGMAGFAPLDIAADDLAGDLVVYDIVTHPVDTPLLSAARAQGLRTIDGLAMLIGQAAAAFEKFFGQPPPREHDAELRAILTT